MQAQQLNKETTEVFLRLPWRFCWSAKVKILHGFGEIAGWVKKETFIGAKSWGLSEGDAARSASPLPQSASEENLVETF